MSFTAFKYFNEVANARAIRRAADRLHVAPSAVSRQLALLEHSFGTPLLERTNSGIKLTAAGEVLERYTRRMFRELDGVKDSIARFKTLDQGAVNMYAMDGVLSTVLPRTISAFSKRHPGISFTVMSRSSDMIIEALINNDTDIGIVYNPPIRTEIEVIVDRADPVMCLVAPDDPMASEATVTLEAICERRLALPHQRFGLRQIFDNAVSARRLKPMNMVETNNIELPRAMATTGTHITIGPVLAAQREIEYGELVAVPISVPTFLMVRSSVCVHKDRPLSYAAHEFLKFLRDNFANSDGENWV